MAYIKKGMLKMWEQRINELRLNHFTSILNLLGKVFSCKFIFQFLQRKINNFNQISIHRLGCKITKQYQKRFYKAWDVAKFFSMLSFWQHILCSFFVTWHFSFPLLCFIYRPWWCKQLKMYYTSLLLHPSIP